MSRSLKDDIAGLLGVAQTQEVDVEGNVFGDAAKLNEYDDEQLAAVPTQRRRIQGDLQMEDEAYKGKRVSVAAFNQDADFMLDGGEDDSEEGDDEEGDLVLSGSDEGEGDEEDEEDEVFGSDEPNGEVGSGGSGDEEDEGDSDQGDEDDAGGARAAPQGEVDELEAEYEQLESGQQLMSSNAHGGEKEEEKALAVMSQQVLYEKALEMRILLQPALSGSNRLPPPPCHAALRQLAQAPQPVPEFTKVAEAYSKLAESAAASLESMLEAHEVLLARVKVGSSEAPPSNQAKVGSKRPRSEQLWDQLSAQYEALAPVRDSALDKWHSRTILSSGSAALRSTLRALNQSVSAQVAAMMRDPAKIIRRTQLTLSTRPKQLCAATVQQEAEAVDEEDLVDQEARDPDTFDDGEFYQQLLKEFLERSGASGAGLAAGVKSAKKRKVVDRRASKGRKIRYQVQEKLVNFMAPVFAEPPQFAEQLFASLFGHAGK